MGPQPQSAVWLKLFYSPEIKGIARANCFGIAPAATDADSANEQVEKAADPPEPVAIVPSRASADATNRAKGLGRICLDGGCSRVDDPRTKPLPMMSVPKNRIRTLNDAPADGSRDFVVYWMIANRRTEWNFSLQRAVEWARELGKSLVVLEALRTGYRWASDRLHYFVIQGMAGLSPYLRFGHVSSHQVFAETTASDGWNPGKIAKKSKGGSRGWWGASEPVEAFLDELITWREAPSRRINTTWARQWRNWFCVTVSGTRCHSATTCRSRRWPRRSKTIAQGYSG